MIDRVHEALFIKQNKSPHFRDFIAILDIQSLGKAIFEISSLIFIWVTLKLTIRLFFIDLIFKKSFESQF